MVPDDILRVLDFYMYEHEDEDWLPLPSHRSHRSRLRRRTITLIIAALEHNDRVCQVDLDGLTSSRSQMGCVTDSVVHKPFWELIDLRFDIWDQYFPIRS